MYLLYTVALILIFYFGGMQVIKKRIAAIVASGALVTGVLIAAPASAVNYAPGLPPAQAGVPNNPPAAAPITTGVTLVDAQTAAQTQTRQMARPPAARMGNAPRPSTTANRPVALGLTGLTPGSTWVVQVKPRGGQYGVLGSVVATSDGQGALSVFTPTRRGIFIVAFVNVQTGETRYIKVRSR
jgi:hypothetical protein